MIYLGVSIGCIVAAFVGGYLLGWQVARERRYHLILRLRGSLALKRDLFRTGERFYRAVLRAQDQELTEWRQMAKDAGLVRAMGVDRVQRLAPQSELPSF